MSAPLVSCVLALAAYSPKSQIRARVWSFDADETIDGLETEIARLGEVVAQDIMTAKAALTMVDVKVVFET